MEYNERFKTGHNVIDTILEQNWELVDSYVERLKQHIKEKGFGFSKIDEEYAYLNCILDFIKSISKFVDKNDKLIRTNLSVDKGLLDGSIVISRNGEEYILNCQSIYASGDVQRLHIRYLIKSNLPKTSGKSEAQSTIEQKIKKSNQLKTISLEIKQIESNIEKYKSDIEKLENTTLDSIIDSYKNQFKFDPSKYSGDDLPGYVHKDEETFNNFIQEISEQKFMSNQKLIQTNKNLLKSSLKSLEKAKQKYDDLSV